MERKYTEEEFLKRMQGIQLEMLLELKRVCEKHNIPFYLAFGTCLGAIRHKGFIPWDDDIDVIMYKEDLDKLYQYESDFAPKFSLQSHQKDDQFGLLIHRIRNSETTLIEKDHVDRDINHGVYIDIYPLLDYKTGRLTHLWQTAISLICRLFVYNKPPMNKGSLSAKMSRTVLAITPNLIKKRVASSIYRKLSNTCKSTHLTVISGYPEGNYYRKELFGAPAYCQFEGFEMPIPTKVDEFLTDRYGDYMKLPPKELQVIHHDYVFADFDKSYIEYRGIKYCVSK